MLIAAAQMRLSTDLPANEQEILRWARRAAEQGVRVMNFPEASLTGYLFGGFAGVDLLQVEASLEQLQQAAQEPGVSPIVDPNGIVVQRAGESLPELLTCDADPAARPLWSA
ncbi:MAG: nitrilase-related carbon-nitrogen hydrolase [Thermodesulfobacteriota bacterium]